MGTRLLEFEEVRLVVVTPLVLRARLAPRFRPKKNFQNEFLGF